MTPMEFDANVRQLTRVCPWLSVTSGYRSEERNSEVGGHPTQSKHLLGMAVDFVSGERGLEQGREYARKLGFWTIIHGDPPHLHVQGLPPDGSEDLSWWFAKYSHGGNNGYDQ